MIPAIPPIPPIGNAGLTPASQVGGANGQSAANPSGFQNLLGQAIDSLNGTTSNATAVSLQAAAGKVSAVDATVATTEAQLETQLASTVVSSSVAALNSVMNMPA